jgi:ElaB/YqjD/DUF883 family membrane-anchored ribosome-binding protein
MSEHTETGAGTGTQSPRTERAEDLIREVKAKAGQRFEAVREDASEFAGRAGETIRDAAGTGKGKAADALHGLADAVRGLAGKVGEGAEGAKAADFARKAADNMDRFSDVIRDKTFDELGADVKSFVRERPAMAVGVAAVVGFALARMLKSGGDHGDEA